MKKLIFLALFCMVSLSANGAKCSDEKFVKMFQNAIDNDLKVASEVKSDKILQTDYIKWLQIIKKSLKPQAGMKIQSYRDLDLKKEVLNSRGGNVANNDIKTLSVNTNEIICQIYVNLYTLSIGDLEQYFLNSKSVASSIDVIYIVYNYNGDKPYVQIYPKSVVGVDKSKSSNSNVKIFQGYIINDKYIENDNEGGDINTDIIDELLND